MADDNIVGADEQASADERDAGRGGGLAGDREEGLPHLDDLSREVDHSTHLEDHDARAAGGESLGERPRALGGEGGDAEDPAAATAGSGGGPALRSGKGRPRTSRARGGNQQAKQDDRSAHGSVDFGLGEC